MMILEAASTPCRSSVPPSPQPATSPLGRAPGSQGADGTAPSSKRSSTGPDLDRPLAGKLFPPLSSLDEPSRLAVYSLYLDALVKPPGQRQQKGQLCHAGEGQGPTAGVAAAAAVLSSLSAEELLGSLPMQLDWELMLEDIQAASGSINLTALKLVGLLLQAPSTARLLSDVYCQKLLQVVKEGMGRGASKERCKLAIWVVQTQQLPPGRLSGHGASLLAALEVCLPLDNPWQSPMISLQALLAVQRLLVQLPEEATRQAGSWAPAGWQLMLATGFEGGKEVRPKAAAYRQIREGAVRLTRELGAALGAYRRGEMVQGGHHIAAAVTSRDTTSGGCVADVRTSVEDKAVAAAAAEADLVGRQLASRLTSSMLPEMMQMIGRVTTLPRGTEPPGAAVEAAVAAVVTWGAAVLVLGPSFVRVNGLGQKMLDTVRPCFTCTSNTQLPCAAFAAWRDLFDAFREIGEVPPPPPPQRVWCSSGGGGGSRSLSRLRLIFAPIEHTAKHDKRPEVLQAALLCWQYLVQLLTRSYGQDATLCGGGVAGPVATAVAALEDAVELRLPVPFHTTGSGRGHQAPGQPRRPSRRRPAGATLPDVWSWAVAPVAKAVLLQLATGPLTPKAAAAAAATAGGSGVRLTSHKIAEIELVLVNLIDTTCTASVGLLAQTLLHALPSGSGGGGSGNTPSGKEPSPGTEATAPTAAPVAAAASAAVSAAAMAGTAICATAEYWAALLKRMFRCAVELTAAEAMRNAAYPSTLPSDASGCQPLARGSPPGPQGWEAEPSAMAAAASDSAPVESAWHAWGDAAERVLFLLLAASLSSCKDEQTVAATSFGSSRTGSGDGDDGGGNKAWIMWLQFCFTVPGLLNPIPDIADTALQPMAPAQTPQQQRQQQQQQPLQLLEQREALRRLLCRHAGPQLTRLLMRLLVPYTLPAILGPPDSGDGAIGLRSKGCNSSSSAVLVETVTAWLAVSRALDPLATTLAPQAGSPDVAATTSAFPEWWGDWRSHLRGLLLRNMYTCSAGEPGGGCGGTAVQCLAALCCPALRLHLRIRSGSRSRGQSPSPLTRVPRSPLSPLQPAAAQQQDARGEDHDRAGCQEAATIDPSCKHRLPCPYAWVLWETVAGLLTELPTKEAAMTGAGGGAGPLVMGPLVPEEGGQGANRRRREAADAMAQLLIAPLEAVLLPGTAEKAVAAGAADTGVFGDGRRMAKAWEGLLSALLQHSRRSLYGIASAGRGTGRPDAVVIAVHGIATRFLELLRGHNDMAVEAAAVAIPADAPAWRFLGITGAALARHIAAMNDAFSSITAAASSTTAAAQDGWRSRTQSDPTSFSGGGGGDYATPVNGTLAPTTPRHALPTPLPRTPGRGTAATAAAAALTPRGARGGVDPVGATASAAASLIAANASTPGGMSPSLSCSMVAAEAAAITAPALGPELLAALASAAVSALLQSRRPSRIAGSERAAGLGGTDALSMSNTEQNVNPTRNLGLCPDALQSAAALQRPPIAPTTQHQQYQLQSGAAEALAEALDAIPDVLLALAAPPPAVRGAAGVDAAVAASVGTATAANVALQALQAPLVTVARDLLPHVPRQHGDGAVAAVVPAAGTAADIPSVVSDNSGGVTTGEFGVVHAATAVTAVVGLLCQLRRRGYDVTAQLATLAPLLVVCLRSNHLTQPAAGDGAQPSSKGGSVAAAGAVPAAAEAEASVLSQATVMALESLLADRMPRLHNRVAYHLRQLMLRKQQLAIARTAYRNPRESTPPSPGSCSTATVALAVSGLQQLLLGNAAFPTAAAGMTAHAAPVTVGNLTPLVLPQSVQLAIDGLAWDGAFLLPDSQLQTTALPNRTYALQLQQHLTPMASPVSQLPQRQLNQRPSAPTSANVGMQDREVSARVPPAGRRSDIRSSGGNGKRSFKESQTEYVRIAPSPSPAGQTAAAGAAVPNRRASKRRRRCTGLTTYTALDGSQTGPVGLIGMGSESQDWSSDDDMIIVADRGGAEGGNGNCGNGPHVSGDGSGGNHGGCGGANGGNSGNGGGPVPHPWDVVSSRPPGAGPQSSAAQRSGQSSALPLADRTRPLANGGAVAAAVMADHVADGSAAPQAALRVALLQQPNDGSYAPVHSGNGLPSSVPDPAQEVLPCLLSHGAAKPASTSPKLGGVLDQQPLGRAPEPPSPRCPSPVPDPALDQLPPSHLRQRRSSALSAAMIMTRNEPLAPPSSGQQSSPTPTPPPPPPSLPQQQAVQKKKQHGQRAESETSAAGGEVMEVDKASSGSAEAATEDVEMVPDSLDPHILHCEHERLQGTDNADVVRAGESRMMDTAAAPVTGTGTSVCDHEGADAGADRSNSGNIYQLTAAGEACTGSAGCVSNLPGIATMPNRDKRGGGGGNGVIPEVVASGGGDVCAVAKASTGDDGISRLASASAAAAATPVCDVDVDPGAARAEDEAPLLDGASQLDLAESYDITCGATAGHGARRQRLQGVSDHPRWVLAQPHAPHPAPISQLLPHQQKQQQKQQQAGRAAAAAASLTQPNETASVPIPAMTPVTVGAPVRVATVDGVDELLVESTQQQEQQPGAEGRRTLRQGLAVDANTPGKAPCAASDLAAGGSNTTTTGCVAPSEISTKQRRGTGARASELTRMDGNPDEGVRPAGLPLRRLRSRTPSNERDATEDGEGGNGAGSSTAIFPPAACAVTVAAISASVAAPAAPAAPVLDTRVASPNVAAFENHQGGELRGIAAEPRDVVAPVATDAVHRQSQGRQPCGVQANGPMEMQMQPEAKAPETISGGRGAGGTTQAGELVGMRRERGDKSAAVPTRQAGPGSSGAAEAVVELRRSLMTMHAALEGMDVALLLETGAMLSDTMSRVHIAMVRLQQRQQQQAATRASDSVSGVGAALGCH